VNRDNPIKRAERARVLLADDMVAEAREHMRESLTRAMWRRHELADADKAKLDAYVRHYGDFFAWFDRVIADGRVAEADLKERSRLARVGDRLRSI
jgi:hypothetical protein